MTTRSNFGVEVLTFSYSKNFPYTSTPPYSNLPTQRTTGVWRGPLEYSKIQKDSDNCDMGTRGITSLFSAMLYSPSYLYCYSWIVSTSWHHLRINCDSRLSKSLLKLNPLLLEDETYQTTSKEHCQADSLLAK